MRKTASTSNRAYVKPYLRKKLIGVALKIFCVQPLRDYQLHAPTYVSEVLLCRKPFVSAFSVLF